MPVMRFTPASLPCGMAMPLPTPVEPRRSRCRIVSNTSRSGRPVIAAAFSASSCRQLLFRIGLQRRHDRRRFDQIAQVHDYFLV
jgi:hypothetical protein